MLLAVFSTHNCELVFALIFLVPIYVYPCILVIFLIMSLGKKKTSTKYTIEDP